MKKVLRICINGKVKYPQSLAIPMDKMLINGGIQCIPNGCIELDPVFAIDKYFPLRARQNGRYYVEREVILADPEVDIKALAAKHLHFETDSFLVREEFLEESVGMVEESVAVEVITSDCTYVGQDQVLGEGLIRRYGTRLYIDGNLTLEEGSGICLDRLEKLHVRGDVYLMKKQEEALDRVNAVYRNLILVKGRHVANKVSVTVDQVLLDASPEGIKIENCVSVRIKKDVKTESILERLSIFNCAKVICDPGQKSVLELVCGNVAKIADGEKEEGKEEGIRKLLQSKVVNAETYIL